MNRIRIRVHNMNSKVDEITNRKVWDDFVDKYGNWSFFQSYDWGEVQKKIGHEVLRLGFFDNGELVSLFQTIVVRARRGTYLHVRHGPLFKSFAKENLQIILTHLKKVAQKTGAWFIRISPMLENTKEYHQIFLSLGLKPAPIQALDAEYCWVLDISKTEAVLLSDMRKTTRYLIRQAQKLGVIVRDEVSISDFLTLYKATSERHGFVPHSGITAEYEVFKKNSILIGAYHEGTLLSSALIVFFGKQAIYHHGASIPTKIPASYLVQWEAIKRAQKNGCTIYNFWGIAPSEAKDSHPWKGITLFKQGFGGEAKQFIHAHDLPTSPLYHISYTIELVRRMRKGY